MSATFAFETARIPVHEAVPRGGRFIPTKQNNPCDLCGDTSGDCRTTSGNLILCKNNEGDLPGWHFLGQSSNGLWGKYLPEGDRPRSSFRREKRPPKRVGRLSNPDRSQQFQAIAKASGLATPHQKHLQEARGRSPEEIALAHRQGIFWTWQDQETFTGVTPDLPGVTATGRLRKFGNGMAIGIIDPQGQILGAQIRPTTPSADGPKYFWVSSAAIGGEGQQLANGETPLGYYRPHLRANPPSQVLLTEGYLKAWTTAQLHQAIVIAGGPNANFVGSPQQFRAYLDQSLQETGSQTVILCPDAGSVLNRNILSQYQRAIALAESWGFTVDVEWHGQLQKNGRDIDELPPGTEITTIRPEAFWAIVQEYNPDYFDQARHRTQPRIKPQTEEQRLLGEIRRQYDRHTYRFFRDFGQLPANPQRQKAPTPEQPQDCFAIVPYQPQYPASVWQQTFMALPYREHSITVETVPTFDQWVAMGSPKLLYPKDCDRKALLQVLIEKGHHTVLLTDACGSGKSHTIAELAYEMGREFDRQWEQGIQDAVAWGDNPKEVERPGRALYITNDPRNPSTAPAEQIPLAPAKHGGLVIDSSRTTATGQHHRRRVEPGQIPDFEGNCTQTEVFTTLHRKGFQVYAGLESKICQGCDRLLNAQGELACPILIEQQAHRRSATMSRGTFVQYQHSITEHDYLFTDEASQVIQPTKDIEVSLSDIEKESARLAHWAPKLSELIRPLIDHTLNQLRSAQGRYGHAHYDFVLGMEETIARIQQAAWVEFDAEDWLLRGDIWEEEPEDSAILSLADRVKQAIHSYITSAFEGVRGEANKLQVAQELITPNALYFITAALTESQRISLRTLPGHRAVFTVPDHSLTRMYQAAKARILADTTLTRADAALYLGIPKTQITQVEQEPEDYRNLTVYFVEMGSSCGAARREESDGSVQNRIHHAIAGIKTRHPGEQISLCDRKAVVKTGAYEALGLDAIGYKFLDNRGSNQAMGMTVRITVGHYIPNLGAMQAQWQALTGEIVNPAAPSPRFMAWLKRHDCAEQIQDTARPRSQLYPDRSFHHYILGTPDRTTIAALEEQYPGLHIAIIPAAMLHPQAAPKGEQAARGLIESIWSAIREGTNASITQLAEAQGLSKGRISQICSDQFGMGFASIKESLVLLERAINNKTKPQNLDEMVDESVLWLAQTYLPQVLEDYQQGRMEVLAAIAAFLEVLKAYGRAQYEAMLAMTPLDALLGFYSVLVSVLPLELRRRLRRLVNPPPLVA